MTQFDRSTLEGVALYESNGLMGLIRKINSKFRNASRLVFVIMLTSSLLILTISFNVIYSLIGEMDIIWFPFPSELDKFLLFFVAVLFAPLFETWFGQYLPYYLLNKSKYLKERSYLILVFSAAFFGINHFYSLFYIVFGFLMGLGLMYGYMIRIKTDNRTFLLIAVCHSLLNFTGFIVSFF